MALVPLPAAPTGEAQFVSQLDVIERVIAFVCARHHVAAADADDFASHVKLRLIEDDYAILRKFQGRSSLRTYLSIVIGRLFLDYRISAWGKWRPSAEAMRAGPVALLLEQLMARDGFSFEEACVVMTTNHQVTASRAELERLAAQLPPHARRRFEGDDALEQVPAVHGSADAALIARERDAVSARLRAALRRAKACFETQDQVVIAMRFEDGRTVADIAAVLRLDQKRLYRRFDRLLRELRKALEREGITAADVRDLLAGASAETGVTAIRPGTAVARPSLSGGADE